VPDKEAVGLVRNFGNKSREQQVMLETIDMLIDARMELKFKSFNQFIGEFR